MSAEQSRLDQIFRTTLRKRFPQTVPAQHLAEHLLECLSIRAPDQPWPDDVVLKLEQCNVSGDLIFPPGTYPAVVFESVSFQGGVLVKDVTFQLPASIRHCSVAEGNPFVFDDVAFDASLNIEQLQTPLLRIENYCRIKADANITRSFVDRISDCTFARNLNLSKSGIGEVARISVDHGLDISASIVGIKSHPSAFTACIVRGAISAKSLRADGPVSFSHCQFGRDVAFNDAALHSSVEFSDCMFSDVVAFGNAELRAPLSFRHCTFIRPPSFHLVKALHTDTSFIGCRFKSFATLSDLAAYRKLRRLVSTDVRSDYLDGALFACEKRTEANIDLAARSEVVGGVLSKLYDWGSSYGQSILRPLIALALALFYFGALYVLEAQNIESHTANADPSSAVEKAIGLLTANMFAPFAVLVKTTNYSPISGYLLLLSVLQTVTTLILVTLLILAIRRRFRKTSE